MLEHWLGIVFVECYEEIYDSLLAFWWEFGDWTALFNPVLAIFEYFLYIDAIFDSPKGKILLSCLAPPRCLSSNGFHRSAGRLFPSIPLLRVAFSCSSLGSPCINFK